MYKYIMARLVNLRVVKRANLPRILLLICFVVLFIGVPVAGASPLFDTPTPTNTPNYRTPPPTPTSGGGGSNNIFPTVVSNYGCPMGMPAGYGTVTPSTIWLGVCGQCIPTITPWVDDFEYPTARPTVCAYPTGDGTNTPSPSCVLATYGPTETGVPSSPTVTITPIYSPSPTAMPTFTTSYLVFDEITSTGAVNYTGYMSCNDYYNGLACDFDLTMEANPAPNTGVLTLKWWEYGAASDLYITVDAHAEGTFWYDMPKLGTSDPGAEGVFGQLWSSGFAPAFGDGHQILNGSKNWIGTDGSDGGFIDFTTSNAPSSSSQFVGTIYLMPQAVLPTPGPSGTGTPTPDPGTYCSEIHSEGDLAIFDDVGFWGLSTEYTMQCFSTPPIAPGDILGVLTVMFGWFSDFIIDSALGQWLFSLDVIYPAQTVCFQPYDFYEFALFGVAFSWTYFVDIFIIGYAIAHFTSK